MLNPEVIEWQRQREQRREEQRPHLELPLPPPGWEPPRRSEEPKPGSTVIVIEY